MAEKAKTIVNENDKVVPLKRVELFPNSSETVLDYTLDELYDKVKRYEKAMVKDALKKYNVEQDEIFFTKKSDTTLKIIGAALAALIIGGVIFYNIIHKGLFI